MRFCAGLAYELPWHTIMPQHGRIAGLSATHEQITREYCLCEHICCAAVTEQLCAGSVTIQLANEHKHDGATFVAMSPGAILLISTCLGPARTVPKSDVTCCPSDQQLCAELSVCWLTLP